jgi:hypothetical protein
MENGECNEKAMTGKENAESIFRGSLLHANARVRLAFDVRA